MELCKTRWGCINKYTRTHIYAHMHMTFERIPVMFQNCESVTLHAGYEGVNKPLSEALFVCYRAAQPFLSHVVFITKCDEINAFLSRRDENVSGSLYGQALNHTFECCHLEQPEIILLSYTRGESFCSAQACVFFSFFSFLKIPFGAFYFLTWKHVHADLYTWPFAPAKSHFSWLGVKSKWCMWVHQHPYKCF